MDTRIRLYCGAQSLWSTQSARVVAFGLAMMLTVLSAPAVLAVQPGSVVLDDPNILASDDFLASHPDQRYRRLGVEAYQAGRLTEARKRYRMAARYADKLSQAAYAEMLWNGEGGEADRPLAYAWMDLAAERGTPWLVAQREHYWKALEPAQRQQALQVGQAVYAEYQDAVAQPRLEREIRVDRKRTAGSHLGNTNNRVDVCVGEMYPGLTTCRYPLTGDVYFHERFWQPDAYWDWQDEVMTAPTSDGQVEVGNPTGLPPVDGR